MDARTASPTRPEPRANILRIAPYVPGKSKATGAGPLHKLSSNETPLGPSPKARAAFAGLADKLALYPDGAATELRAAIGEVYGLNPDRLVCGNGSDEILAMLATAFLGPGDEAIFTEHAFLVYRIVTHAAGATPVVVPETDLTADVDAILDAVTERTRIVFLANPNNPTGTYVTHDEVRRLHAGLPPNVLLVLDAAYAEYVRRNDYEAGMELVATSENVVMTRTFSKIHGLAALRLGWAYAPAHVIDAVHRVRGPFNVNAAALAAGVAAIADRAWAEAAVDHNAAWLPWLRDELAAIGIPTPESVGNFLLLQLPDEEGRSAEAAEAFLSERGIVVRQMAAYGLPTCLRMTVGTEAANRAAVAALADFMGRARG